MPRNPYEKDMIDGLRDLREQVANLNKVMVTFAEAIDTRFDAIEQETSSYRKKRIEEEAEQARIMYEKKAEALKQQENGSTTQKMKTIAAEQVKAATEAKSINWGEIFRRQVVPALVTTFSVTLFLALLAAIIPGFAEVLLQAFG